MRVLNSIFLLLCSVAIFAEVNLTVAVGNATMLGEPSGVEQVFIFENLTDAEFRTTDSDTEWWRMEGTDSVLVSSGVDYLYPEDTTTYVLRTDKGRTTFAVIDYSEHRLNLQSMSVDMAFDNRCQQTKLDITGDIPQLFYYTTHGSKRTIDRQCEVHYNSLAWTDDWQDSLCVEQLTLYNSLVVGAPLQNTRFALVADQFVNLLNLTPDTLSTDEYEACAVAAHYKTITTIRGTEEENTRSNELERPVEDTQISGSAPLEILFQAKGNKPVAKYYQWQILKGSDLIVQRTDEEHRYVFDDYGEYRVLLWVSNDSCRTDSVEIAVSVSTSQLLVPNVFTPNGDGQNDEFRVMYRSIVEFDCWVYNRWGKLVYHWSDPAKGWDGTINGRPAAEGAYFYVIRAKGADAEEGSRYRSKAKYKKTMPTGIYQLSGDINLIR